MADISIGDVPDTSVLVGSNAYVLIDDKEVAFMDDIDIDENYNQTDIRAVGDYFPKDTKSLFFEGTFTAKLWLLTDEAEEGKADMLPDLSNILTKKGNLVEIREKSTGKRIMRVVAKLNTAKTNIASSVASSRNITMKIIRIQKMEGYN